MGKAYLARHYVRVDGAVMVPGEVFEAAFAAAQEERLVRLGAVEVVEIMEDGADDGTHPPIAGARVPPLSGEALDGTDSPEGGSDGEVVPPLTGAGEAVTASPRESLLEIDAAAGVSVKKTRKGGKKA